MSRNIIDVINQIKPILTEKGLDVTPLDAIISSAEYTAPENAHLLWQRLQEELIQLTSDYINARDQPLPDWIVKISNIVMDKPVKEFDPANMIGKTVWDLIEKIEPIYQAQNFDTAELEKIRQFLVRNNTLNERAAECTQAITSFANEMLNEEIHRIGKEYIGTSRTDMPAWLQEIIVLGKN